MSYCPKCGAQVPQGALFCPACGANLSEAQNGTQAAPGARAQSADERWLSLLSYLGPLVFIPMFVKRDSDYVQFHAKQGLLLFSLDVLASVLCGLLGTAAVPVLLVSTHFNIGAIAGIWWVYVLQVLFGIFTTVLAIIGIVNALSGNKKELPLIGKINLLDKLFESIRR